MTDNFRPVNDDHSSAGPVIPAQIEQAKAHGLGPAQPQMQPFLRTHYGNAVPNAQAEVI